MLSCLLVVVENVDELQGDLPAQTLDYIASALAGELRRFDRIGRPTVGELAVVLPGADGPDGEVVARRILERVRAIKVESEGTRHPLELSVGLAAWRAQMSAQALIARARAAAARQNGDDSPAGIEGRTGAQPERAAPGAGAHPSGPAPFGRIAPS
jgi:GGDEF domain-containing protein